MNKKGLKPIAIFEAFKGLLALIVGLGVHELSTNNVKQGAEDLLSHLHLNPASHYPSIFISTVSEINSANLIFITWGAALYALVRFVEAYGLWHRFRWTEWLALISGAMYLPFELYEFITKPSLISTGLLAINSAIVIYLYFGLRKQGTSHIQKH